MIVDFNCYSPKDTSGFFVIEGVNGAGKSTLQKNLRKQLEEKGFDVVCTMEPGGTGLGAKIRQILLERELNFSSPLTEVFLFAADRTEHVEAVIKKGVQSGKVVISDRYYYSTVAFQGYGYELDTSIVKDINLRAIRGCMPDLVILLDLPVEIGLKRNKEGQKGKEFFERQDLEYHERIRKGFLDIARDFEEKFIVIDATKSAQEIEMEVLPYILKALDAKKY